MRCYNVYRLLQIGLVGNSVSHGSLHILINRVYRLLQIGLVGNCVRTWLAVVVALESLPITSNRISWKQEGRLYFQISRNKGTGCLPITSNRISWKLYILVVIGWTKCSYVYRLLQIGLVGNER